MQVHRTYLLVTRKSIPMKKFTLFVLVYCCMEAHGQITSPIIKANFGVDADLSANYFNGFVNAGNDDWFNNGNPGPGTFVIDTTGAAYINKLYITNPATRMAPFFRGMRYPQFSVVNGVMLIDGIFIRDHHGDDSTVFASGSNKNGMSPALWSCPVSQGIPDKNDILDMYMHVRRDGPNVTDSLWMFSGLSLDNITGSRYFDFEMYQTDILFDRSSLSFKGYGPDAGHTSWKFDASGNILQAGDIIFTAEFGNSGLSLVEARIWVKETDWLTITPTAFSWGGQFDGDGASATYGYASISPKTAGTFYTGLQCSNNTWAGPFGVVLQNNTIATTYTGKQFMEFSVNLSKLGLDPLVTMGDPCKMPFRRILVKSRASNSFTAELKDFVGPFDFFRAPHLDLATDFPFYCGVAGLSTISVTNPLPTSLYTWTTPNGHIVGDSVGTSIQANKAGMYIVSQQLLDSCGTTYANDTLYITMDSSCTVLRTQLTTFNGSLSNKGVLLNWKVDNNNAVGYFELERSTDNSHYTTISKQQPSDNTEYNYTDDPGTGNDLVFYRLKTTDYNGNVQYSKVVAISIHKQFVTGFKIMPNPVKDNCSLLITSLGAEQARVTVFDLAGKQLQDMNITVQKGSSLVALDNTGMKAGVYIVRLSLGGKNYTDKMVYLK